MNLWDILILAAVAVAVFFALRSSRKRTKGGCCDGCCGGSCDCCTGCSAAAKTTKDKK